MVDRRPLYGFGSQSPQAELERALNRDTEGARRAGAITAIACGAQIDAPWLSDGSNLLMTACACGRTEQVRLLCELGANVGVRRTDGATALWCAGAEHGQHPEAMEILLRLGATASDCGPGGAGLAQRIARDAKAGRDFFNSAPERLALLERWELDREAQMGPSAPRPLRM